MPQPPPHYVLYPITTLQPPFIVCYTALQASCVRPDPRNSYPGPKSPSRSPPDLPETPLLIMQQELKANILLLARGPLGFEGTPNISVSRETALEQFVQSSPHILPETSSEQGRWPLQRTSFSLTRSIIFHILTLLAFLTVTHCYKPSLLHDCQSSCFQSHSATQHQVRDPCREPRYRIPLLFLFWAPVNSHLLDKKSSFKWNRKTFDISSMASNCNNSRTNEILDGRRIWVNPVARGNVFSMCLPIQRGRGIFHKWNWRKQLLLWGHFVV